MSAPYITIERNLKITPFWQRIPDFFSYPLRTRSLLILIFFSAASLLLMFFAFSDRDYRAFFGLLWFGIFRYCLNTLQEASLGHTVPQEGLRQDEQLDENQVPHKLWYLIIFWAIISGLLMQASYTTKLLCNLVLATLIPASIILLASSGSILSGLNPIAWFSFMRSIGRPYLLFPLLLFPALEGLWLTLPMVLWTVNNWLVLPVFYFVFGYFFIALFNMMGYCLYQYHRELGIAVDVPFDHADPKLLQPTEDYHLEDADPIGAKIDHLAAEGDLKNALKLAYDQQQQAPENIAVQERYHRLLCQRGKPSATLNHARHLIPLLLQHGQTQRALEVLLTCRTIEADFTPSDGHDISQLAHQAERSGQYALALKLLHQFDRRFPNHPAMPEVYFLSATLLNTPFKKPELALKLLKTLVQHFPQHPLCAQANHQIRGMERMGVGGG